MSVTLQSLTPQSCIKPLNQTPRCASHHWIRLRGVHPTIESDSAVCIPPLSQALRCASHHWVRLRGVHPTTESDFVVSIITSWSIVIKSYEKLNNVHHTAESNCTLGSNNRKLCWSLFALTVEGHKNKILFLVNTAIMVGKVSKFIFSLTFLTSQYLAHRGVKFILSLCSNIKTVYQGPGWVRII